LCLGLGFITFFSACSNSTTPDPVSPSSTPVQIAVEGNPLFLIYDWGSGSHCLKTKITLTESAGIGTTINSVDLKFMQNNNTVETHQVSGGNLSPNGQLTLDVNLCTSGIHDSLQIDILGSNANSQQVALNKNVKIEYVANLQGTYEGTSSGIQGSTNFNEPMTFEIKQEGKLIEGSWAKSDGASGVLTGSIGHNTFTATMEMVNPCAGLLDAEVTIEGNGFSLKGLYKGNVLCVGKVEAEFSVKRK